jgi:branched-chain amino acid transport system substrate-binding protein
MSQQTRRAFGAAACSFAFAAVPSCSAAAEAIKIGLVTALSGQSALSGEAITRGLQLAIDEVNAKGELMGDHDALGAEDYVWAQFVGNSIVPVGSVN